MELVRLKCVLVPEMETSHGKNSWNQHWRFNPACGDRRDLILN